MKKTQTQAERQSVMSEEMERVKRELAHKKRTGNKRTISWISVDLDTGDVAPPPNALRVVK